MIPIRLNLKNSIGVLKGIDKQEIDIDFTKFKHGLVGIFGRTGSCKSTILECMNPYRKMMTRDGMLYDHFFDDGMKLFIFEQDGERYESKILVDGNKRSMVATLTRMSDNKLLNDKLDEYDDVVESIIGDQYLYTNSIFSAQTSELIITRKDTALKTLFSVVFNLTKYNREYMPVVKGKITDTDNSIKSSRQYYETLESDLEELSVVKDDLKECKDSAPKLKDSLDDVNKELIVHRKIISKAELKLKGAESKIDSLSYLNKDYSRLEKDISNTACSVAAEAKIIEGMIAANDEDNNKALEEKEDLTRQKDRADKLLDNKELIVENVHLVNKLRNEFKKIFKIQEKFDKKQFEYREQSIVINHAENNVKMVRKEIDIHKPNVAVLDSVPCIDTGFPKTCPLLSNATQSKTKIVQKEIELNTIKQEIKNSTDVKDKIKKDLDKIKVPDVAEISEQISALENERWESIEIEMSDLEMRLPKIKEEIKRNESRFVKCDTIKNGLREKLANLESDINKKVEQKKVRLKEIEDEIAKHQTDLNIDEIKQNINRDKFLLVKKESAVNHARELMIYNQSQIDNFNKQLEFFKKKEAILKAKSKEIDVLINDLGEYQICKRALQEIPVYELESLSVMTTDFTNELLSIYSDSMSVKMVTQMSKSDGKNIKEVFKVMVFNKGDEVLANNLSGGEKEIVDTALRMGLELTLNKTQSRKYLSSFWDESDKSIDPPSALVYLEMQKARHKISGKHYTFIISHRKEVQEQFDQKIMVEDL